ncbi:MAG TPA: glutathione S-transferase N-terminal domain-containing protein [Beijerinckiaceae bacterium]|jgi:glutathione S-transferase|nr:glutathione S-transferase N-terminal domain-containing protein [Beijerinckiaceae bacterium]
MYALYYFPGNASLLPHMMLREIGSPFELRLVDRAHNAQNSPEYLKLNPNGRIPVLIDGDLVLYETAAIALHLCDRHPESRLAPPPGSAERPLFYRWLVHLTNTPQAEYRSWFYPHEFVTDESAAATVKASAERRLNIIFDRVAEQLGSGPWLLGERFSAVDLYLFMLIRWGRAMPRPPRALAPLGALAERVLARPAVQAALEAEGLKPPIV